MLNLTWSGFRVLKSLLNFSDLKLNNQLCQKSLPAKRKRKMTTRTWQLLMTYFQPRRNLVSEVFLWPKLCNTEGTYSATTQLGLISSLLLLQIPNWNTEDRLYIMEQKGNSKVIGQYSLWLNQRKLRPWKFHKRILSFPMSKPTKKYFWNFFF